MRIFTSDNVYSTKVSILSQDDFWEDDEYLHSHLDGQPVFAYQWYNADDDSSSIDYDEEYNY